MHVLIVVSWYKTVSSPLQGSFFEEQARALMKKGIRVTVLYPDIKLQFVSRFKRPELRSRDYTDAGLATYYLFVRSVVPRNRRLNYKYLNLRVLKKFFDIVDIEGKPDIIHAHGVFHAGIVAEFISKKVGLPYVITEHYSGLGLESIYGNPFLKNLVERIYGAAIKVIMVSRYQRKDLLSKYSVASDHVSVIPNMVSDMFFQSGNSERATNPIVLFSNSFINANKNHKLMLDAFADLLQYEANVILKIGGGGDLLEELKDYADSIGIGDKVIFAGLLSRSQVKSLLEECTLFLSTSKYETFGIAIIEALACCRPVVTTNSGGPLDIIESPDGIVVEDHTPRFFSAGISKVLDNYQNYNLKEIGDRCYRRFSEEVVSREIVRVYMDNILVE